MLIIPLKCSPRYDLREPLARWLDGNSSTDVVANPLALISLRPDFKSHDCRQELIRLASLRNCLSDSIMKPTSHKVAVEEMALQDCHEYHAALYEFIRRGFPTNERERILSIALTWKASVGPQTETHGSLEWDRACTIWNIAALESYLASIQASDKQGRKQAVKHCSYSRMHDALFTRQYHSTTPICNCRFIHSLVALLGILHVGPSTMCCVSSWRKIVIHPIKPSCPTWQWVPCHSLMRHSNNPNLPLLSKSVAGS